MSSIEARLVQSTALCARAVRVLGMILVEGWTEDRSAQCQLTSWCSIVSKSVCRLLKLQVSWFFGWGEKGESSKAFDDCLICA